MTHDLRRPPFVLLDDSRAAPEAGPSFLFRDPDYIITATKFDDIAPALAKLDAALESGLHLAGWISYEVGAYFEDRVKNAANILKPRPQADEPLIWFMATRHKDRLNSHDVLEILHTAEHGNQRRAAASFDLAATDKPAYLSAIDRIKNYIEAGDVYQVNHTFPVPLEITGDPLTLYRSLRQKQPVAYGAYIDTGDHKILSLSPELFTERRGTKLMAKPMKGTAPRGHTLEEDKAASVFLQNDPKSKAENLMIVDLIRNDLSKISKPGSVKVDRLFETEIFPTLHQMTSTVTATCDPGLRPSELLAAMFPCGSVTGAPKIRAEQIINSLEDTARGVYCGAIGYFSPRTTKSVETWVLNVPIRTLCCSPSLQSANIRAETKGVAPKSATLKGRLNIGSGIVADSTAEDEFQECLLKASFLTSPQQSFDLIETMRWSDGSFQLLELHVQRLRSSALYFGFAYDANQIASLIAEHSALFEAAHTYKCRLLLDKQGAVSLTSERLPSGGPAFIDAANALPTPALQASQTVSIADQATSSGDVFLQHKTSKRALYNTAFQTAQAAGHLDTVFFNEQGFLTEGAISTIFLVKAGLWSTPPLNDGVLPGVLRADLLARYPVAVRPCSKDDLLVADAIYIANALRGLRQVRVV